MYFVAFCHLQMLHGSTVPSVLFEKIHHQTTVASFKGLEYYPSIQQALCTSSNKGWEPLVKYEGNSISKLQIRLATYVFELSAGNCHR
jgi:hypothetical protein